MSHSYFLADTIKTSCQWDSKSTPMTGAWPRSGPMAHNVQLPAMLMISIITCQEGCHQWPN